MLALWELGLARSWATSDALPTAVRREVITMDPRGLGRSEPSLACPEVERLVPASLAAPSDEKRTRRLLLGAVAACRARLVGRGVDPSAYSLAEAAADAEDLRVALGIERWNLGGYGSGARLAFEILRRDGEHVRSLYLDSPEAPQTDLLTTAKLRTRTATSRLAAAYRTQPACNRRFPALARSLARTLERRGAAAAACAGCARRPHHPGHARRRRHATGPCARRSPPIRAGRRSRSLRATERCARRGGT